MKKRFLAALVALAVALALLPGSAFADDFEIVNIWQDGIWSDESFPPYDRR